MLAIAFLNPLLLVALPLCAIPIVIHLLNRRRFQRVPWAAMEYLLAAMKRNRKRLRMEQWLVLLLRTLAVLLLVFLVARPHLAGGALLGARTHHVVVLDDSASTTQRSGSTQLFEKQQDRVRTLVEDLAARRGGDLLSLVRTSRPLQPDLWGQRIGPDLPRRIATLLKETGVSHGSMDLGLVLQATRQRAAGQRDASRTEYYVVGDRRARDWAGEDDKPRPSLVAALTAMGEAEHLTVLGAGGPPANLAVVDLQLADRLAVAAVPVTLAVAVQNLGLDPADPTTVAVEVDGKSRVVQPVPALMPGERVVVPIEHTFHQSGYHRVEAQIEPGDTFPLDDRRTLVLDVRDKSRVLLVDGQPDEDEGETFYLFAAMEMAETGIEPQVVTDTALEGTDLAAFDFVWLCNVQAPSPAAAQRLEQYVAAGGGLGIACGNQVDAGRWNELLWRDGKGPLPLPLGEVAGDPDRPETAVLVAPEHPICTRVTEVLDLLIGNVLLVKRWTTIDEVAGHGAAVVARIHDADGPPLLATRTFGSGGEVVLLAVAADRFWSNLPSTDLFVVLVNQIHRFGARRRDLADLNLLPDGNFVLALDQGTHRADVTVRALPDAGDERTFTAAETPPAGGGTAAQQLELRVPMAELRQLGAYEIELARHDGAPDRRLFARNPPLAESHLLGFTDAAFARLYPPELQSRIAFVGDDGGLGSGSGEGELWHLLAALLLAGLLLESVLAWRFGRR
ncbi:MAG: BatA domain-containing protein [Planctomycetes bacterium]|nr:BatA domain-containing protein [Planctomycetota bacterium]